MAASHFLLLASLTAVAAFSPTGVFRHSAAPRSTRPALGMRVTQDSSGAIPKVVLESNGASAEVYLLGACVTSYKKDGVEYLKIRPDAKLDGSKPISGGIPHCFPQFGPGELQQHGFARNLEWKVVEQWGEPAAVLLQLVNSKETEDMWPHKFKALYLVSLAEDGLSTQLQVLNTGDSDFSFTGALHSYFDISSTKNLAIKGAFTGATYLDKLQDPPAEVVEEAADLVVDQAMDRVYQGVTGEVYLDDSAKGKRLTVAATEGWKDTVIWNPYGDEGMGYDGFVCAEAACALEPVTVAPGKQWTGKMSLVPSTLPGAAAAAAAEPVAAEAPAAAEPESVA